MKFLLIISHNATFRPTQSLVSDIGVWIRRMTTRKIRLYGNPLRPADEARTVRVRSGRVTVKNGPSARSKEKIAAYELIECKNLEEAVVVASEHPMARAATIEVRPVWEELARQ
jgi:hypothetical protein